MRLSIFLLSLPVIGVMGVLPTHTIFGFLGPRFLLMALPPDCTLCLRRRLWALACACSGAVSSALVHPRCVFLRRLQLNKGQCRYVAAIPASCVRPRAVRHRYRRRQGLATSSHRRVSASRNDLRRRVPGGPVLQRNQRSHRRELFDLHLGGLQRLLVSTGELLHAAQDRDDVIDALIPQKQTFVDAQLGGTRGRLRGKGEPDTFKTSHRCLLRRRL